MWNGERGFGFIEVNDYEDLFFHISSCLDDYEPELGDCVWFSLGKDKKKNNIVAVDI
jgi:cold shock CspA family protein